MSAISRSPEFEQAVEVILSLAEIPGLRDGDVYFDADLTCTGWAPKDVIGDGLVHVSVPDDMRAYRTARRQAAGRLAAELIYHVDTLPDMVEVCDENEDSDRATEYREMIAKLERHLGIERVAA